MGNEISLELIASKVVIIICLPRILYKEIEAFPCDKPATLKLELLILKILTLFKFTSLDNSNPKVQEWEALMWEFQEALANTPAGSKWLLLDEIYNLNISEQ